VSARPSLEFFFFDAGGGHRSAATSLKKVIAEIYPGWDVTLVNLQDLLRPIDPFHRLLNIESQNIYNQALKKGFTYGGTAILTTLQTGIRYYRPKIEELLRRHWAQSAPDMVVSLIPNFNRVMFNALRAARPDVPYVTIMTDIADCPPHFWQEPQEQFLICGSAVAVQQAFSVGYNRDRVYQTSGMILKPGFYKPVTVDRRQKRQESGLDPDLPTALIMFGGNGSRDSIKILARLRKAGLNVQTIVMCGHNKVLQRALQKYPACHAVGFTENVADYMALADFFIGKPGPGSVSEALHMGLPVIIEESLRTMPQERYNAVWVRENGLGIAVPSFSEIASAVATMLDGETLSQLRRKALALNNRALYEIPDMMADILEKEGVVTSREILSSQTSPQNAYKVSPST